MPPFSSRRPVNFQKFKDFLLLMDVISSNWGLTISYSRLTLIPSNLTFATKSTSAFEELLICFVEQQLRKEKNMEETVYVSERQFKFRPGQSLSHKVQTYKTFAVEGASRQLSDMIGQCRRGVDREMYRSMHTCSSLTLCGSVVKEVRFTLEEEMFPVHRITQEKKVVQSKDDYVRLTPIIAFVLVLVLVSCFLSIGYR